VEGWIKLHRKIQGNPLWMSESFTDGQAWVDMLMLANHSEGIIKKRGIRVDVKRGYIGWSEIELGKRWKWSRGKVRRFFHFLVQQNMIEIEQQNIKLTTLIKIVNYDDYQGSDTTDDTTKRTSDGHQTDIRRYTNKNDKKEKTEKNKEYSAEFESFYSLYPVKKEKVEAYKVWKKMNGTRPTIEVILSALQKQIDWRESSEKGEFVPNWKYPATWLNKGCWDDEIGINDKKEAWEV
jgi:hypothetical protein